MALRRTRTVLLGITGLAIAGSMAGLGTFATFTDSTTAASQSIATGTVRLSIGAEGGDNRLTVGASGLVPGDSLQRRVKITNNGSESLASVTLTTDATTSSVLDTDTTDGLKMKIERCSGVWTESASAPYTYTCDLLLGTGLNNGTRSEVLARRPVIGANTALASMASLAAGATDDMVVTVDLPTSAGNTFQNKTSVIRYVFNATQRGGVSK